MSALLSQYAEEVETFRQILDLPDPKETWPKSSTTVLGLDNEKDQQELRPRGPSAMLPLNPILKDAFEKDFLASNLPEGKYIKPPASTAKYYKVRQPCFEDKLQELNTDFAKICISPKPSGTPVGKVPLQVIKELEHQARRNLSTINFTATFARPASSCNTVMEKCLHSAKATFKRVPTTTRKEATFKRVPTTTRKEAPTGNAPMGAIPLKAVTNRFPQVGGNRTLEAPWVVFDPTQGDEGVETPPSNDSFQASLSPPVGGRLRSFRRDWLTNKYSDVLNIITNGYILPFTSKPNLVRAPLIQSGYKALQKELALTSCIQSLLSKNAIERVENVKSLGFYSRLFLVPKPHKRWRPE